VTLYILDGHHKTAVAAQAVLSVQFLIFSRTPFRAATREGSLNVAFPSCKALRWTVAGEPERVLPCWTWVRARRSWVPMWAESARCAAALLSRLLLARGWTSFSYMCRISACG
jgi:hypothetical protein